MSGQRGIAPEDRELAAETTRVLHNTALRFVLLIVLGVLGAGTVIVAFAQEPLRRHPGWEALAEQWFAAFQNATAFGYTLAGAALFGLVVLTQQARIGKDKEAAISAATTIWFSGIVVAIPPAAVAVACLTAAAAIRLHAHGADAVGAGVAALLFSAAATPPSMFPLSIQEALADHRRATKVAQLHERLDGWPLGAPRPRHYIWTFLVRPGAAATILFLGALAVRSDVAATDVLSWDEWYLCLDLVFTALVFPVAVWFAPALGGTRWVLGIVGWLLAAPLLVSAVSIAGADVPVAARVIGVAALVRVATALWPVMQPLPRTGRGYGVRPLASLYRRRRLRREVALLTKVEEPR